MTFNNLCRQWRRALKKLDGGSNFP